VRRAIVAGEVRGVAHVTIGAATGEQRQRSGVVVHVESAPAVTVLAALSSVAIVMPLVSRRESDGALLWSWTPPQPSITPMGMALTNNVVFVAMSSGSTTAGVTFAIDLTSHLPVWSYPMTGTMALSKEGALYIVQGPKVAAIAVR
jgi:hypothetical protein